MHGSLTWLARTVLLAGPLVIAAGAPAPAQPVEDPSVLRANAGTVGVISGAVNGTYVRIASDLASTLDDGDRLRVLAIIGKGSVQNVSDLLYLRGVDVAIVQSDVLAYIRRQQVFPGSDQTLQYIAKLYDEEVHLLVRADIRSLADLRGQAVNVDVPGSGTAMTSQILFESLGVPVKPLNDNQDVALQKLERGEIAGLVYVTGKPASLFSAVLPGSGLHFLSIPLNSALVENYLPAQVGHADYPALVPEGAPVDTVAVGTVMAVYGWHPGTERFRKVSRFVTAFFKQFQKLTQPPHHPKWRDVNLSARMPGWTRFPPAAYLVQTLADEETGAARQRFEAYLSAEQSAGGNLTEARRDELFRNFLAWQGRQASGGPSPSLH